MARNAARVAEQLERDRGLRRPHREEVADRQHCNVGLVDARDQRHVAERAGVAREVQGLATLEPDHDPAGLSGVTLTVGARGVEGVDEREADPVDLARAALVEPGHVVERGALACEPALQLDLGNDGDAGEGLGELDRVAHVIAVPMCDRDHVHVLGVDLVRGRLRVAVQERVDVDPLAVIALDPKRRVPEPGQRRHAKRIRSRGQAERPF